MARDKSATLVKNKCVIGGVKTNVVSGGVQTSVTKRDKGVVGGV